MASETEDSGSSWTEGKVRGVVMSVLVGVIFRFGRTVERGINAVFDQLERGARIVVDGTVAAFGPLASTILSNAEQGLATVNSIILSTGPAAPFVQLVVYGGLLVLVFETGRVGLRYVGLR